MAINAPAPIVKAYARLDSLRRNIPDKEYVPKILSDEFNTAVTELTAAGYDVSDFMIVDANLEEMWGGGLEIQGPLLKTRIDAVLTCFRIDYADEKVGIRFVPPPQR